MSKVLKRLYLGNVVAKGATRQLRKLLTKRVKITHRLIANIPVDGTVTGISKVYDGFIYVTAWNSNTYLTTIYEVNVENGDYSALYSQVFYETQTKPTNVIKVNGDLYVAFYDNFTTLVYVPNGMASPLEDYYAYTHIRNLTQGTVCDDSMHGEYGSTVGSHTNSFGYFLSHTADHIYTTAIFSRYRASYYSAAYTRIRRYDLDFSNPTNTFLYKNKASTTLKEPSYYCGKYYGNNNGAISIKRYVSALDQGATEITNPYDNGVLFNINGETFFASDTGYYGRFNRKTKQFSDVVDLGISVVSATNGEEKIPVATNSGAIYILEEEESIIGTWVLNSTFDNSGVGGASINVNNVQMYVYNSMLDDLLTFQPNADGSLLLVPKTTNRSVMLYNTLDGVNDGKTARVEWSGGRYVYVDTDYNDQAKLYKILIVNGDTGSKTFDNWLRESATRIA